MGCRKLVVSDWSGGTGCGTGRSLSSAEDAGAGGVLVGLVSVKRALPGFSCQNHGIFTTHSMVIPGVDAVL